MTTEEAFRRYRDVLQSITADGLAALDRVIAPDIRFEDPFHDVTGAERMKAVFARLFDTAEDIAFVVDDWAVASDTVYFRWILTARLRNKPWRVTGVTRVVFDASGRVTRHTEYWDAASQLYERFPVIGPVLRHLRRRIAGP